MNHKLLFVTHSIILTAMMKEQNIRMNELKYAETLHEEKCYRNIKVSLASIEEHSLADAAFLLWIDRDRCMFESDGGIFDAHIFNDGETKGGIKFISRHSEVIGLISVILAKLMNDIRYFFKFISNGIYSFKEKSKKLSCFDLLDQNRIRFISHNAS